MILSDDPDFEDTGDCALREQVPAPEDEVDGTVYLYYNHPKKFIQVNVSLFLREKAYNDRHEIKTPYRENNIRYILSEQNYERWFRHYMQMMKNLEEARLISQIQGRNER